jgi:hypothetical protein
MEDTYSYRGWLVSDSFLKRTAAVFGYSLVAQLLIAAVIGVVFVLFSAVLAAFVFGMAPRSEPAPHLFGRTAPVRCPALVTGRPPTATVSPQPGGGATVTPANRCGPRVRARVVPRPPRLSARPPISVIQP